MQLLPIKFIQNLRPYYRRILRSSSTSRLPRYDVVIIGGGPVGSSIAYHCAIRQLGKIAVIERDKSYASGSASLSAGGIRQQFSVPENVKMSMYGAQFLKNIGNLTVDGEIPDIQFHKNGYLFLAGERSRNVLVENNRIQRSCGVDWVDLLDKDQLQQKFGWLNTRGITVGSYGSSNEGYFDPYMFVQALRRKAISLGVDYIDGAVVGAKLHESSPSSMRISSVTVRPAATGATTKETTGDKNELTPPPFPVAGGTFVNAAGAWAGSLVKMIASDSQRPATVARLPVYPRRRCIFIAHCPAPTSSSSSSSSSSSPSSSSSFSSSFAAMGDATGDHRCPPSTAPLVIDPSGAYFRPEGQGSRFIMGISPPEEKDRNWEDHTDNSRNEVEHELFEEVVWPTLAERVPAFERLRLVSSWAGFYEYNTLDQNAIIGPHSEVRNLLLCNGFSGHGLQQSPAAGRAIAELISNGIENPKYDTIDLKRFSFERVLSNSPVFETGIV